MVRQEKTAHLDGKSRAGLEGFEPPTHGTGNLHTRKWVCLSPELQAILVWVDILSQRIVRQIVCQFSNSRGCSKYRLILVSTV
jgi:hypothetical protein